MKYVAAAIVLYLGTMYLLNNYVHWDVPTPGLCSVQTREQYPNLYDAEC